MRQFKYLNLITAVFVTVLLVSNIASTKILFFGNFEFDGGTILFPLSYIFGDILTEVYGYSRTRKIIWTGFSMLILATIVFYLVGLLPPSPSWGHQESYEIILGTMPRIVLGSIVAFLAGEFSNSYILAKMKVKMKGKKLWARTISSTLVGEILDTGLFVFIAFAWTMNWNTLLIIAISNYIFKVGVEILFTPITYAIVGFLKKNEKEDFYDKNTDFSPFSL